MRPRVDSMPSLETKVSGANRQEPHRKPQETSTHRISPGNTLEPPELRNAQRELMRPRVDSMSSLETMVSVTNHQETPGKPLGNPKTSKRSTGA